MPEGVGMASARAAQPRKTAFSSLICDGEPTPWAYACKAKADDDEIDPSDPSVLEYIELEKQNGISLITLKEVRATVGAQREQWRLAMQAEVQSLVDNRTFEEVGKGELRNVHHRDILPMKLVTGTKRDALAGTEKKKVRAVVCGNFQKKQGAEDLYTANADITSVRAVLAAAVPKKFGIRVIDVKTAFLNAHLPDSFEPVFVRPPQALVEFGLVPPGTVWRALKAIYGLRISPKAWGLERDKELRKMSITHEGQQCHFRQSTIDPSIWSIIPGAPPKHGSSIVAQAAGTSVLGWIIVYVDDFAIVASDAVSELVKQAIEKKWKISVKDIVPFGSGRSVEYLSVEVSAAKDGWTLSQQTYCDDLLSKWSMQDCRPIASLEDVPEHIEDEEEPPLQEVRLAQRMAGGLNWLATRTRPDIAFTVSQLASAATRAPQRALALGKRILRYLAGTRTHALELRIPIRPQEGGGYSEAVLEGFGDASYEEGWAQTGVLLKYRGMTITWKSVKQIQVPRSTAESEVTAMAFSAQYVEGLKALYEDIFVILDTPILWCDNRAAVHLTASPGEWRTKALVNRCLGVRSLIELNVLIVRFKATLDMQADVLTKFMGGKAYPASVNWLVACHCDYMSQDAGPVRASPCVMTMPAPRTRRDQWSLASSGPNQNRKNVIRVSR